MMSAAVASALRWVAGRIRPRLREKLLITAALTVFFTTFWHLIPRYLLFPPRAFALTPLERSLPFVEGWVYVYLSICLLNVAAPYLTVSRALLVRHAWGFFAITAASFACFALYPVEMLAPTEAPATLLYALILADTRLNNFPSLHASYTVYGLLYWEHVLPAIPSRLARRVIAIVVMAWAAALLLSVLLLKQHYLADLAGGAALGGVAYWLCFARRAPRREATAIPITPRMETKP